MIIEKEKFLLRMYTTLLFPEMFGFYFIGWWRMGPPFNKLLFKTGGREWIIFLMAIFLVKNSIEQRVYREASEISNGSEFGDIL